MNESKNLPPVEKFNGPSVGRFDYLDWTVGTLCFVIIIGMVFGLEFISTAIPLAGIFITGSIAFQTIQKNEDIKREQEKIRAIQSFSIDLNERLQTLIDHKSFFLEKINGDQLYNRTMKIPSQIAIKKLPPIDLKPLLFLGSAIDVKQDKEFTTPITNASNLAHLNSLLTRFDAIDEMLRLRSEIYTSHTEKMKEGYSGSGTLRLKRSAIKEAIPFYESRKLIMLSEYILIETDKLCRELYEIQEQLPYLAKSLLDSNQLKKLNGVPKVLQSDAAKETINEEIPNLSEEEIDKLNGQDYPYINLPSQQSPLDAIGYPVTQIQYTFHRF